MTVYYCDGYGFSWLAIGMQQWGNAGSNNGSVDVTFPISFTKAVYQIQLTYNNNSYENPTYEIKDTKSFSYWSKYGGDKLWLAIGAQQWGFMSATVQTITYPIAVSKIYSIVMTTKATRFRYAPWPSDITTRSFVAYSDVELAWWMLIAKTQALQTATQAYGDGP